MNEKRPLSEARKRANKKWNDENLAKKYDRLQLVVPKGRKITIENYAKECKLSVNSLMNSLLFNALGLTESEWKKAPADQPGEHKTEE